MFYIYIYAYILIYVLKWNGPARMQLHKHAQSETMENPYRHKEGRKTREERNRVKRRVWIHRRVVCVMESFYAGSRLLSKTEVKERKLGDREREREREGISLSFWDTDGCGYVLAGISKREQSDYVVLPLSSVKERDADEVREQKRVQKRSVKERKSQRWRKSETGICTFRVLVWRGYEEMQSLMFLRFCSSQQLQFFNKPRVFVSTSSFWHIVPIVSTPCSFRSKCFPTEKTSLGNSLRPRNGCMNMWKNKIRWRNERKKKGCDVAMEQTLREFVGFN